MNKKILTILTVLLIASTTVFATGRQQNNYNEGLYGEKDGSPLYELVSDGEYLNVATGETVSEDELPADCKLIGGEGQNLLQRNNYNESPRFEKSERDSSKNDSNRIESRKSSQNTKGGRSNTKGSVNQSQRNFQNR